MANDAPRSILRMNDCPMCGYDVSRLPVPHQCPECGFAYDETMYMLSANLRGRSPTAFWLNLVLLVPIPLTGASIIVSGRFAPALFGLAILMIAVSILAIRTIQRKSHAHARGDSQLWIQRDGVAYRNPIGGWKLRPWSDFERVRLWQIVNGRPVPTVHDGQSLFLTAPADSESRAWWRIWLRPNSWTQITNANLEFDIRCTPREASQIVNDLRARLNLSSH